MNRCDEQVELQPKQELTVRAVTSFTFRLQCKNCTNDRMKQDNTTCKIAHEHHIALKCCSSFQTLQSGGSNKSDSFVADCSGNSKVFDANNKALRCRTSAGNNKELSKDDAEWKFFDTARIHVQAG